jgi:hypothetical protein
MKPGLLKVFFTAETRRRREDIRVLEVSPRLCVSAVIKNSIMDGGFGFELRISDFPPQAGRLGA